MLGKFEGRRGQQRMRWLDSIINSTNMSLNSLGDSEGEGCLACFSPWGHKESDTTLPVNNSHHHPPKEAFPDGPALSEIALPLFPPSPPHFPSPLPTLFIYIVLITS